MVLRKYNRADEKENKRNRINQYLSDILKEELERKSWDDAMEESYIKEGEKLIKKSEFATEYLMSNNPEACNSCNYSYCFLEKDYECGRIGIKIDDLFSEDKISIYKIKDIPKYIWIDVGDCLIPAAL